MKFYFVLSLIVVSIFLSSCEKKDDYYLRFGRPATLIRRD